MSTRLVGPAALLTAAVCWGLLGPVARVALREGVAPLEIAFWRAVVGGLLFAGHVAVVRLYAPDSRPSDSPAETVRGRDWLAVAAFGLVGVSLFYAAYQLAIERGGAALASVLLYTAPAWVAAIGATWLGEPTTRAKLFAIGLTLTGVGGIAASGARTIYFSWAAVAWGLVSALSYALYYPFGKHYFGRLAPATIFAVALPIGAVGLLPLVAFQPKTPAAWWSILFIGGVSTYGAYLAYAAGLQRMEASRASILATLEPVVAAVVAHLWWDERFGPWGYVGAVLVLSAALLAAAEE
jgi:DME family drug/metabolite transporter